MVRLVLGSRGAASVFQPTVVHAHNNPTEHHTNDCWLDSYLTATHWAPTVFHKTVCGQLKLINRGDDDNNRCRWGLITSPCVYPVYYGRWRTNVANIARDFLGLLSTPMRISLWPEEMGTIAADQTGKNQFNSNNRKFQSPAVSLSVKPQVSVKGKESVIFCIRVAD